jgi:hypothetical protein
MTECIEQSLSADSIILLPNGWLHKLLPAGDGDAKVSLRLDREFPVNAGQGQDQVQRTSIRRAEFVDRVPTLFNPLIHDLKDPIQPGFDQRIRG